MKRHVEVLIIKDTQIASFSKYVTEWAGLVSSDVWRPTPGSLVQIWDYQYERRDRLGEFDNPRIAGHGLVGYVVKRSGGTDGYDPDAPGPIFEVITFESEMESSRHNVWHGWLREIKKTSDIKKVLDKKQ